MMNLLLPIIASALFFTLGILSTILITVRKSMGCIIVPSISLVDVSQDIQDKTKITYGGKTVQNLSSTTIKVRNSGFLGLEDSHFLKPLKIIFDPKINLLKVEIIDESRSGRDFDIVIKKNTCLIKKFTLLNGFEHFVIRLIHEGIPEKKMPEIEADIRDVKKISKVQGMFKGKRQANLMFGEGFFNIFFGIIAFLLGVVVVFIRLSIQITDIYFYITVITMILVFFVMGAMLSYAGVKKLYKYFTTVIEVNSREDSNE